MKKRTNTKEEKLIDAKGKTLGRVGSEIAVSLMGKNSPFFERHVYSGFKVKVINASKIKTTVKKLENIMHKRYSGYRGGLKVMTGAEVKKKKGMNELLKHAVHQMLPSNKLKKEMMKNLKIEE